MKILIADDDPNILRLHSHMITELGHTPVLASDGEESIRLLSADIQAAMLDIRMPKKDGLEVLEHIHRTQPNLPVIMISALHEIETAVAAIKKGAFEYLTKPIDFERLATVLRNALKLSHLTHTVDHLHAQLRQNELFSEIVGQSEKVHEVFDLVNRVIETDINIMIIGESGTGKELVARALHKGSQRRNGPFVAVNCSAITNELADSLLFGHKAGAFTGATEDRPGFFEQADKGSIFLDEIGDMDSDIQAKVLRVLEEKIIRRVGEKNERRLDFRVISATNRDLAQAVRDNQFRKDLYFRLEEYPIYLPPLSERRDDIPMLAQHFLTEFCDTNNLPAKQFSKAAMQTMLHYSWPGNIRELKNVVRRSAVRATGDVIETFEFSRIEASVEEPGTGGQIAASPSPDPADGAFIPLDKIEKDAIEKAYFFSAKNAAEAAKLLGISRATMYRKLKKMGYES